MKRTTIALERLEIKADIFTVPNNPIIVKEMEEYRPEIRAYMRDIIRLNKIDITDIDNELMIEVWLTARKDADSDNLGEHGINFIDINGNQVHADAYFLSHLPLTLLKDKREGETFQFVIPLNIEDCLDFDNARVLLVMNITCKQREYMYSFCGKFQNSIKMLMQR